MRANELESERMNAVFLGHFFLMSFLLYLTLFFSLCSFSHSPCVSRSNSAVGSNRANVYTLTNRRTLIFVDWTFFSGVCVCVKIVAIRTFEFLNLWNGTNSNSQHIPDKYVNFTWEFAAITAYWYFFSILSPSLILLPPFFCIKYLIKMWTCRTSCYTNQKECKVHWKWYGWNVDVAKLTREL